MQPHALISSSSIKRAVNIQDLAAALGMHKSTVSQGLSGKGNVSERTRAVIRAKAREMGYEPNPLAQRLATSAANKQVMVCARTLDVGVTTEKLLLIQKNLTEHGFEAPIYTLSGDGRGHEENQAKQMRQLCRQHPRAIICSAQALHPSTFDELASYQDDGGIVISYDVEIPLECDQVIFDREDNAYQAARYLIEAGHRDLGLALSTPRHENGDLYFVQDARLRGFKRALAEAGLKLKPEWVFEEHSYEIGGVSLAGRFLKLAKRPTGLCIVNDYMALTFMLQLQRGGLKIPDDLSVIGHDNQAIAAYCPTPLTSVTHPELEIADAVIQLLTERLDGPEQLPRTIKVFSQLIERKSVATPQSECPRSRYIGPQKLNSAP
jgi:DNA-binding LacI/PurR family transcriptional regulator